MPGVPSRHAGLRAFRLLKSAHSPGALPSRRDEQCQGFSIVEMMVARDGIEPPTPAFSGPRSTTELPGLSEDFQLQFLRGVPAQPERGGLVHEQCAATTVSVYQFPSRPTKPRDPETRARKLGKTPQCGCTFRGVTLSEAVVGESHVRQEAHPPRISRCNIDGGAGRRNPRRKPFSYSAAGRRLSLRRR